MRACQEYITTASYLKYFQRKGKRVIPKGNVFFEGSLVGVFVQEVRFVVLGGPISIIQVNLIIVKLNSGFKFHKITCQRQEWFEVASLASSYRRAYP